jgi:hypothetical protein
MLAIPGLSGQRSSVAQHNVGKPGEVGRYADRSSDRLNLPGGSVGLAISSGEEFPSGFLQYQHLHSIFIFNS